MLLTDEYLLHTVWDWNVIDPQANIKTENQRRKFKVIKEKVDILEKKLTASSFKCEHCEYDSKNEKKLNQHVKKHHPGFDLNVTLGDDDYKELQSKLKYLQVI